MAAIDPIFSDYCRKCLLIDSILDAVVVLDTEGRIRLWNAAAAAVSEHASAQVLGRTLSELGLEFVDESRAPVRGTAFLAPINQHVKDSILGLRKADGSLTWLSINVEPIEAENRLVGVLIMLRDITTFKRINEALRESEEKFRAVAEALSAAFGIVCGTRFVYANRYFTLLSGYTAEELLTKDFPDLVHPDFRATMLERALRRQRGEPVPSRYEFQMLTKSGETRWVDFSVAKTVFKGQPAIIGTGFDITDRKNAEATLRESEAKLKAFADNAPLLMGVVDLLPDNSGSIHRYDNPASCKFLGVPSGSTTNRSSDELGIPKETVRFWVERYRESERLNEPVHFEFKDYRPGSPSWAEVTVVYIGPADAGRSRFIYMAQDITKRKRDDEALREAKAAAERANAAKDQFLAVLSHELRTPLTPVLGGVSLMERERDLSPEVRETLQMIHRNIALEARLIDDLLDVTRISLGKITVSRNTMNLAEAIERAIQICRGDMEARQLHFRVTLPGGPLLTYGDIARLQQVFWNLLKNAIKFTPDGGSISIEGCHSGDEIVVEVSDNGIGIAEPDLGRIFNAFEQGGVRAQRQFGGLGLGLAISKRLVEMHEGSISVHSTGLGHGALFRVRLPAAKTTQITEERQTSARETRDPGKLVLVVEDHHDTALMMRAILENVGYKVQTAADVAQALKAIDHTKFDLLISDLGLPDRSGLELMAELKKSGAAVKGIALSGFGSDEDVERSKQVGFIEHVTKPVEMDTLIDAVKRVL